MLFAIHIYIFRAIYCSVSKRSVLFVSKSTIPELDGFSNIQLLFATGPLSHTRGPHARHNEIKIYS